MGQIKVIFNLFSACKVSCFCSKIRENEGSYCVSSVITFQELLVVVVTRTGSSPKAARKRWRSVFVFWGGLSEAELIFLFFLIRQKDSLMDGEVRRLSLPFFPSLSLCMCVCAQPCIREGGLSGGGPIRSSRVLCVVIAASGCFVCVGKLWVLVDWPG